MRLLRSERGGIFAISAIVIPVFILLTALVLDAGIWFTHKRSLQNRADAGALAAGVEYLSQLANCAANPTGPAATAIADKARLYAGATGTGYNETVNKQSEVTVKINAAGPDPTDPDNGLGNPCQPHAADSISPANALWTDVIVRESNIDTVAGAFGINLPNLTARARVEVKQLTGVRHGGLPFINETGDYVQCVWARFVDVQTGATSGILANGASNPVSLTLDPNTPRRWTADVPGGIDITSNRDDIAVQYYMGVKTGGTCNFSTSQKGAIPGLNGNPVAIDWINVYNDDTAAANQAPLLHHFILSPGTCGSKQVSFIHSSVTCNITFRAEVDHGTNPAPSTIFVDIEDSETPTSPTLSSASVSGSGPNYVGQLTFNPNEVSGDPDRSDDFTQVGRHRLKVRWEQTAGRVASKNCTVASPCSGTFLSEQSGNWQHATYVADPNNSNPMISAELLSGGVPMQNSWAAGGPDTGPFTIEVTNLGVDQSHTMTIRDSVQSSGNRTFTVQCWPGGNGNPLLIAAIKDGCPVPVVVNTRNGSCSPAPPLASGAWDCVSTLPGNRDTLRKNWQDRFDCSMPNNWVNGASPANLNPADPRYAYIFLTDIGRIANVNPNTWLPIRAFLRVYITGWDAEKNKDGWEECGAENEPPPRGYDGNGSQLWGHFVDVISLDDDVIVGDDPCNLSLDLITCKPALVR